LVGKLVSRFGNIFSDEVDGPPDLLLESHFGWMTLLFVSSPKLTSRK